MKHIILKKDRFAKVKSGEMTVWLSLNDDYAKSIQMGEMVSIMNDDTSEICYVRVNGYYVYGTFTELYGKADKKTLGYGKDDRENIELIKKDMYLQCTPEAEKQHGVRGIKFEYLPDYKDPNNMTDSEAQAYLQGMVKGVQKARREMCRYIEKADGRTIGITRFLENSPEMFFASYNGESENDMLKFLLSESIKNAQTLLDKIQEYEEKLGFPIRKD